MPGRMSKAMSHLAQISGKASQKSYQRQSYQSCAKILQSFGRKKGAWSMRVLPLNIERIQLPDAKGR
jgi:hypothetical protein